MNKLPVKCKNRREFLRTCLRYCTGGGLVFASIILGVRKKSNGNESELCQYSSPCQGCLKFEGCGLPKAQTVKTRTMPEGGNGGQE